MHVSLLPSLVEGTSPRYLFALLSPKHASPAKSLSLSLSLSLTGTSPSHTHPLTDTYTNTLSLFKIIYTCTYIRAWLRLSLSLSHSLSLSYTHTLSVACSPSPSVCLSVCLSVSLSLSLSFTHWHFPILVLCDFLKLMLSSMSHSFHRLSHHSLTSPIPSFLWSPFGSPQLYSTLWCTVRFSDKSSPRIHFSVISCTQL